MVLSKFFIDFWVDSLSVVFGLLGEIWELGCGWIGVLRSTPKPHTLITPTKTHTAYLCRNKTKTTTKFTPQYFNINTIIFKYHTIIFKYHTPQAPYRPFSFTLDKLFRLWYNGSKIEREEV